MFMFVLCTAYRFTAISHVHTCQKSAVFAQFLRAARKKFSFHVDLVLCPKSLTPDGI